MRLHTTGRLATRMSDEARQTLANRLQPWLPTPTWWQNPPAPLEVEVGMGNGMAMYARAKAQPNRMFLGCEVYLNGLETLVTALEKHPLPNVKISGDDARDMLDHLPDGSISRLLVPYPDPWPKTKHHKRRIVEESFLTQAARKLQPEGELWVITDWPSYAFHAITEITRHKGFKLAQTMVAAADCKPSARLEDQLGPHHLGMAPTWWVPTKYEQKAHKAGRAPWFLLAFKEKKVC